MQNPKTGGSRWVPDIRPENIDTYTEQNENQSADYKIVDAHPIIGGVLDKLAFFRTHASAVWYNKMKNITVLQKLDNLASNIGVLTQLATTDKTSLVAAVNELNEKMDDHFIFFGYKSDGKIIIPPEKSAFLFWLKNQYEQSVICAYDYTQRSIKILCGAESSTFVISDEADGNVTITPELQTFSFSFAIIM